MRRRSATGRWRPGWSWMSSRWASSSSRGGRESLADGFRRMPRAGSGPAAAACSWPPRMELSRGDAPGEATALGRRGDRPGTPARGEEIPARLAAALIRLALSRRSGDLEPRRAAAAARPADAAGRHRPGQLARIPGSAPRCWPAAAWSNSGPVISTRPRPASRRPVAAAAPGTARTSGPTASGYLALVEALRGRLGQAAELAAGAAAAGRQRTGRVRPARPRAGPGLGPPGT